jgi:hypothetical protein
MLARFYYPPHLVDSLNTLLIHNAQFFIDLLDFIVHLDVVC